MITNFYSFFDKKTAAYLTPFTALSVGAATRVATDLVADRNTVMGRHPADFQLVHIGYFDDSAGQLGPIPPVVVAECVQLVAPPQSPDLFNLAELQHLAAQRMANGHDSIHGS